MLSRIRTSARISDQEFLKKCANANKCTLAVKPFPPLWRKCIIKISRERERKRADRIARRRLLDFAIAIVKRFTASQRRHDRGLLRNSYIVTSGIHPSQSLVHHRRGVTWPNADLLIADINTAVSGLAPDSPAVKILSPAIPLL